MSNPQLTHTPTAQRRALLLRDAFAEQTAIAMRISNPKTRVRAWMKMSYRHGRYCATDIAALLNVQTAVVEEALKSLHFEADGEGYWHPTTRTRTSVKVGR